METLKDTKNSAPIVLSSEAPWQGRIIGIREDRLVLPEEKEAIVRQYVAHPGAVGVVVLRPGPLPGSHEVLLIEQYRHPVRAKLWEIPAGLLDIEGEPYVEAAQRELREEADLLANQWDVLVDFFNSPGGSDESMRIFLAREVSATPESFPRTDEEIGMRVEWVDLDEAVRLVLAGNVHNPSAVTGILAAAAAKSAQWQDLRPASSPWMR